MPHLCKLRNTSVLKWVLSSVVDNQLKVIGPSLPQMGRFHVVQNHRFYRTKKRVENSSEKTPRVILKAAETALLEYLHSTSSLQFIDAEYMSKNSPFFVEKLVRKVGTNLEDAQAFTRHLRYHPINEFEPFFESLGLTPSEYYPLLPRHHMFLADDSNLLENFHVLCEYGVDRRKVGKIYKEAREVFCYAKGVLLSKLQAYETLGISNSSVAKLIASGPDLLVGDVNVQCVDALEMLKKCGIQLDWIAEHFSEHHSYNWSRMLALLNLLTNLGYSEVEIGALIGQHEGILFECSGYMTLSLIGFLLKTGLKVKHIRSTFLQFPEIQVGSFFSNVRKCYVFFNEIEMESNDIGEIIRSHPLLLGSCTLKKTNSLLSKLSIGKKRLCKFIIENPNELRNWVLGSKIGPLPKDGESQVLKTKFLLDMGFIKESNEMKRAMEAFRGKGSDIQERFDCIVNAGINKKDVYEMIKVSPQILNQSKAVIEKKLRYLVEEADYPISDVVKFPSYLNYTTQRVMLRLSMYNWLVEKGTAEPKLALSTIVACSDTYFNRTYVNRHPRGLQVLQDLKKQIVSE